MSRVERIPRSPNSFILYRSHIARTLPPAPEGASRSQAQVSQLVAKMWNNETLEVKAEFDRRATVKKREHEAMYPDYKYKPRSKGDKAAAKKTSKRKFKVKNTSRTSPVPDRASLDLSTGYLTQNSYSFDGGLSDIWSQLEFEAAYQAVSSNAGGSRDIDFHDHNSHYNFDTYQAGTSSFAFDEGMSQIQPWESYGIPSTYGLISNSASAETKDDFLDISAQYFDYAAPGDSRYLK